MRLRNIRVPPGWRIVVTLGDTAPSDFLDVVHVELMNERGERISELDLTRDAADAPQAAGIVQSMIDRHSGLRLLP